MQSQTFFMAAVDSNPGSLPPKSTHLPYATLLTDTEKDVGIKGVEFIFF